MEYFFIGERELMLAFMLAGVKGTVANNRQEALDAFNLMTGQSSSVEAPSSRDRPKVLILTEDVSDMLADEVSKWQMKAMSPLIVEIPGLQGHLEGRRTLTDAIKEAVGIQV